MSADYLQNLNDAVEQIVRQKTFSEIIHGLKEELSHSEDPFVWSVIDLRPINCSLPEKIKTGWVFTLKLEIRDGQAHRNCSM